MNYYDSLLLAFSPSGLLDFDFIMVAFLLLFLPLVHLFPLTNKLKLVHIFSLHKMVLAETQLYIFFAKTS